MFIISEIIMNHEREDSGVHIFSADVNQNNIGFIKKMSVNLGLAPGGAGPGSDQAIATAYNGEVAFYGELPAADFITGDQLASEIGLTAGTSQNSNTEWLKFGYIPSESDTAESKARTLFRPKKAIRNSLSWDDIYTANAVYGGYYESNHYDTTGSIVTPQTPATVTVDGNQYIVRLMRSHITNDLSRTAQWHPESEYSRIMMSIHQGALDCANYGWYTADNVDCAKLESLNHSLGTGTDGMYTDEDLLLYYEFGDGNRPWQIEVSNTNGSERLLRGSSGVSRLFCSTIGYSSIFLGWFPLLELIED